ncbi:MAG: hypothetical protein LBI05_09330 [Planctomycetaceae bacterium]|jgi:hypothetical protein|nr:hypothetical protein [Planctomycetaceae bacterium]
MNLFLDYLWIWIVLTCVVGLCGYVWYVNNPSGRNLVLSVLASLLTLALGLTLYYGVETDNKSITRTLDALVEAVEQDDSEAVCRFISPKAENVQKIARENMRLVSMSRAKYHSLQIEVNDATSPPTAMVQFSALFYWKNKVPIDGMSIEQPLPQSVRFEIELVKTKDRSWLLTNKFQFFPLRNYQ